MKNAKITLSETYSFGTILSRLRRQLFSSNVSSTAGGERCATKAYVPATWKKLATAWRQLTNQRQKLSPRVREIGYPLNIIPKLSTLLRVFPNYLNNAQRQAFRVEYALSRNLSPALIAEYILALPDKQLLQQKLQEFYEQWKERGDNK